MNRSIRLTLLLLLCIIVLGGCNSQQNASPVPSASPAAQDSYDSFLGVRLIGKQGNIIQEWAADNINLFQPVQTGHGQEAQLFIYRMANEQPELLLEDGTLMSWPAPDWTGAETGYGNDYGNNVLYADRLLNDEIFAVNGNRTLYLVNIKSGAAQKLYSAERPIYGMSASPDNSMAALLVASEPYIGPNADLIVLDRKGNSLVNIQKASVQSHSDGFLFIYPMAWKDPVTLAVPAGGYEQYGNGGVNLVNIQTRQMEFREKPALSPDLLHLFEEAAGQVKFPAELHFLPEPGEHPVYYAVQGNHSDIWLLNQQTRQAVKLGSGRLLKWTGDGNLLVGKTTMDVMEFYIGTDPF
ncbi:hypothetical protein [Paenibacillus sp. MMS20-IR301]|uniref:hypothetical protein n=1 Tax=Paenibacillus sp. MMS20-IR301 TaxID=2895946 RepID=UPI0028E27744|nr:hypothetical protein [Paenibacillus sp. MMS20-IR301]WNS45617.1 hypothetical protein LOS79_10205 [Paenibacillus sp. MMS20-IR301]